MSLNMTGSPVGAMKVFLIFYIVCVLLTWLVYGRRKFSQGLLDFPGHQTIFNVDFPAAGAGAVYPVGRADDFVMLPTLAISILPVTVGIEKLAMPIGRLRHGLLSLKTPIKRKALSRRDALQ